jgi:hypothetical protein
MIMLFVIGMKNRSFTPRPFYLRLFINLRAALQTPRQNFKDIVRHARIRTGQPIENVLEWKFGIFATGFAAGDHTLRSLKSLSVDEDDVRCSGVESKKSQVITNRIPDHPPAFLAR